MRNQRAGQATFIPLDTIQVKSINDKFRAFAKGTRLAVDVVQYEPAIQRAIHHACGNALVCDSMEVARYVCYEKGQEVKGMCVYCDWWWFGSTQCDVAVTLEGTIIHKSGLITGGRSTHSSNKKWDEKDVQGEMTSFCSLYQIEALTSFHHRSHPDSWWFDESIEGTGKTKTTYEDGWKSLGGNFSFRVYADCFPWRSGMSCGLRQFWSDGWFDLIDGLQVAL